MSCGKLCIFTHKQDWTCICNPYTSLTVFGMKHTYFKMLPLRMLQIVVSIILSFLGK